VTLKEVVVVVLYGNRILPYFRAFEDSSPLCIGRKREDELEAPRSTRRDTNSSASDVVLGTPSTKRE